ncbi:RNA-directed DNA polymerase, eukaryota [Artemisia annua]|uniref:RNA-directed DNA polymerase, eukaryota n=1 Tax=Artemisia annua TaxID=35608 RepID=A0A2U1LWL0_ARTAN|nr:RNA-directed DNA polymerase, eukaryota [Artemisia annua]
MVIPVGGSRGLRSNGIPYVTTTASNSSCVMKDINLGISNLQTMEATSPGENDRFVWSLNKDGVFSVASVRQEIDKSRTNVAASKTRWIKCIPIKVNITAWKVKMDALPLRFNMSRRGIDIASISCPLCESGVENSAHLFLSCSVADHIYRKIARWWNIPYVGLSSYTDWLGWINSARLPGNLKAVLEGVIYVMWWVLWNFRNKTLFENEGLLKGVIFDNIVSYSYTWWVESKAMLQTHVSLECVSSHILRKLLTPGQ